MANIGDIYYTFRGDGARLQADAKVEGGKAGTTLGKSMSATLKQSFSGEQLGKGLVQGLGFAGAVSGFNLVSKAAGAFTDAIGDSIKGAIADEESQNRLKASLMANIPAWNGNTDAIEANILSKQRLGFDDETLRDSLTVLAGATHDVTRAQNIMNTAMDLSRFKGIDLRTASEALIKVEGGQYRSLKQLGIKLKDNATQQDALNAVQAVANGQAEAYSQTVAGKMLAAQTAFNEKLENLGYKILPAVAEGLSNTTDFFDSLDGSTKEQIQSIERDTAALIAHGGSLEDVAAIQERLNEARDKEKRFGLITSQVDSLDRSTWALGEYKSALGNAATAANIANERFDALHPSPKPIEDMTQATKDFQRASEIASKAVVRSWDQIVTGLVGDLTKLQTGFFDPIEAKESQLEANRKLREGIQAARLAKTSTEHHDAAYAIETAINDEITALGDLQAAGNLTGKDVTKVQNDAKAGFKALGIAVPKDLQKIIDGWGDVAALPKINLNISAPGLHGIVQDYNSLFGNHHSSETKPKPKPQAAGGPQYPGRSYLVGERGPEIVMPRMSGYTIPHDISSALMSGASGGSTGMHVELNVAATSPARKPTDIIRELRIASRDGTLDPRRR